MPGPITCEKYGSVVTQGRLRVEVGSRDKALISCSHDVAKLHTLWLILYHIRKVFLNNTRIWVRQKPMGKATTKTQWEKATERAHHHQTPAIGPSLRIRRGICQRSNGRVQVRIQTTAPEIANLVLDVVHQ